MLYVHSSPAAPCRPTHPASKTAPGHHIASLAVPVYCCPLCPFLLVLELEAACVCAATAAPPGLTHQTHHTRVPQMASLHASPSSRCCRGSLPAQERAYASLACGRPPRFGRTASAPANGRGSRAGVRLAAFSVTGSNGKKVEVTKVGPLSTYQAAGPLQSIAWAGKGCSMCAAGSWRLWPPGAIATCKHLARLLALPCHRTRAW